MKRLLLCLVLCLLPCTACTALPAEERSFAVVLGVSGGEEAWTVYARIPTYQSGGGYATVSGEGETLPLAMAALDAAAPMQLHLGQLRLMVFSADTARSADFPSALDALSERHDLRPEAALAVTGADMSALMEALKPESGARLSKSLDVLMETHIAQGTALSARLSEVLLMGQRQQPVLMNVALEGERVSISGGWPVDENGRVSAPLTADETQLLALMLGRLTAGTLSLQEGAIRLTAASAQAELQLPTLQQTSVRLQLHSAASPLEDDALAHAVATACLGVLNRLSAMGCDALGVGRQAITHVSDMEAWQEIDWPRRYRDMDWSVSVGVTGETQ